MKFQKMSEAEAREASSPPPLPDGTYDFEIAAAEEKNSKSTGTGMFELQLRILLDNGKARQVRDYLMVEGKAAWRLRQACEALGLMQQYDAEELTSYDFEGRSGRCALYTQKDPNEQYPPQNKVKNYIKPPGEMPLFGKSAPAMAADDLSDEIPF